MGIYRGPGGTGDATQDAASEASLAVQARNDAVAAKDAAEAAQAAAELAETNAETAETNAETAETAAEAAQTAAEAAQAAAEAVLTDPDFVSVVAIEADITTVAGIAADVTTVAGISADVTAVAAIDSDVTAVATIDSDVTTVAGIAPNVTTVAGISGNVTTVATNNANVTTVATNIANVNSVGTNIANVNSVAGNSTNINAVAGNAANINTVAGISANVTTVAGVSANVTTVATNIASVNTNATNIANINQNAANIVAIQNASTNATNAANSATAAAASATSASASAAAASAVALGNEPVRHSVRPSLLLDFANTKTLDPRITFTRGSTGTFYDGKTVAKAEENLLIRSQEFDNVIWSKQGSGVALAPVVTANHAAAPDGTTTAERVEFSINSGTATADLSWLSQTITVTNGLDATFSIWLRSTDGTSSYAMQIISPTGAGSAITVTGTWTRFTVTAASSGAVAYGVRLRGGQSPTNANTADILIWGAQVEQRSSVTAYTPTTTQAITNYIPALQTAASGVARFEHNPVTGESLGLEIEEQRTNLLTYSEQFNNAAWTKNSSTATANTIVAPDGTLTGDKLVGDGGTNTFASQSIPTTAQSYALTVYAKKGELNWMRLTWSANSTNTAWFNLNTGALGTVRGGTATMTLVGNGWYRCSFVFTATATTVQTIVGMSNADDATTGYTGNSWDGIYIWGAQLEAGAFATSYIKTEGATATRNADNASMTGTNFSSWYRADEGTVYSQVTTPQDALIYLLSISDGSNNNRIEQFNGSTRQGQIVTNNADQALFDNGTISASLDSKIVLAYKLNDSALSLNGASPATDTSCLMPVTVNRLSIGGSATGSIASSRIIKKLAYYPARLTNAELQGLTTV